MRLLLPVSWSGKSEIVTTEKGELSLEGGRKLPALQVTRARRVLSMNLMSNSKMIVVVGGGRHELRLAASESRTTSAQTSASTTTKRKRTLGFPPSYFSTLLLRRAAVDIAEVLN